MNDFKIPLALLVLKLLQLKGQITGDLRLVSKSGLLSTDYQISEGLLEVYRNGQWGTVCSQYFGRLESEVACRQLGFNNSRMFGRAYDLGFQPNSSISIWLHRLECNVSSSRLIECEMGGTTCSSHNYDTAISCLREGTLRIVTASGTPLFANRGRLEIYLRGSWAALCFDEGFGLREARTSCQQLGYVGATYISSITELRTHPQAPGDTPLYNLDCSTQLQSSLSSLLICNYWSQTSCAHNCDVGISCELGNTFSFETNREDDCYHRAEDDGVLVDLVPMTTTYIAPQENIDTASQGKTQDTTQAKPQETTTSWSHSTTNAMSTSGMVHAAGTVTQSEPEKPVATSTAAAVVSRSDTGASPDEFTICPCGTDNCEPCPTSRTSLAVILISVISTVVVIIVLSVILAVTVRKYRRRKHHGGIKLDEQEPLCEEEEGKFNDQARPRHKLQKDGTVATIDMSRPSINNVTLFRWENSAGKQLHFELIDQVSAEWRKMGRLLGLSSNNLDVISRETLRDCTMSCERVLSCWIDSEHASYPPTWRGLYDLLRDVRKVTVAETMKEALETHGIQL